MGEQNKAEQDFLEDLLNKNEATFKRLSEGGAEPGSEEEIKDFCSIQYGVEFPMFAKIDVNGASREPLYQWLTTSTVGPEESGDVKWNFGKFLVGKDGELVGRFDPSVEPESADLKSAIQQALAAN